MAGVTAIILAGGTGLRMDENTPKQLLRIEGKPVFVLTSEKFQADPDIDTMIIVSNERYIPEVESVVREYWLDKVSAVITGGKTRQDSVYRSLSSIKFGDDEILLLHDAARPFISREVISRCIDSTREHGAAGVYVPAIDTIAEIESDRVRTILPREKLHYTQTPQCFRYRIIRDAHERALRLGIDNATDDVTLVIEAGYPVAMVRGEYSNIKITTPYDFAMAGHILAYLDNK
jgi:2-C-methyl-D-erythritol 4-phosphate cytidylyltransferase